MLPPAPPERLVPDAFRTREATPGVALEATLNRTCPNPTVVPAGNAVPAADDATSDALTNWPFGGGVVDMTGPKSELPAKMYGGAVEIFTEVNVMSVLAVENWNANASTAGEDAGPVFVSVTSSVPLPPAATDAFPTVT